MKEKFIPVWYSSFGTDEEQEEQIKNIFGQNKLKEIYLDGNRVYELKREFAKEFPNAKYVYGMGGFVYSVLSVDRERALTELKNIVEKINLQDKYVLKNKKFISKDLIYAEQPTWMLLPENKYEKKLRENDLTM